MKRPHPGGSHSSGGHAQPPPGCAGLSRRARPGRPSLAGAARQHTRRPEPGVGGASRRGSSGQRGPGSDLDRGEDVSWPVSPPPQGALGLVVLNISQLRYRTVELLRTTGPSGQVRGTRLATLRREEPLRPRDRERRRAQGDPPRVLVPAGPCAPPLQQAPRAPAGRRAAGTERRRRPPRSLAPRGRTAAFLRQRPARRLLCGAPALPGAGMRPRRAGPTGFSRRAAPGPAGRAAGRPRPGDLLGAPARGWPDSPAAQPRPGPLPPARAWAHLDWSRRPGRPPPSLGRGRPGSPRGPRRPSRVQGVRLCEGRSRRGAIPRGAVLG